MAIAGSIAAAPQLLKDSPLYIPQRAVRNIPLYSNDVDVHEGFERQCSD